MATTHVNGNGYTLPDDPRTTLLDALREHWGLTGSKKGCDHGQCGACTVILDGTRVNACLVLARQCEGSEVVTVEGLGQLSSGKEGLHPMQQSFLDNDAFQCGYCTPGQLCSAVAMIDEFKDNQPSIVSPDLSADAFTWSDEEIRERLSGNLCRCGAYPNIVAAVKKVLASGQEGDGE